MPIPTTIAMPLPYPHLSPWPRKGSTAPGGRANRPWIAFVALISLGLAVLLIIGDERGWFGWRGAGITALALFALLLLPVWPSKRLVADSQWKADFREFFDNIDDAIFIHDLHGHFIEANRTACERLGYRREELLRLGPAQIDTPESAARIPAISAKLQREGRVAFESAHRARGGQIIPVEINARIANFGDRTVVISVARDLRGRASMREALRLSEENARLLLDAAPESAFLLTADGLTLAANEVAARRFGQTPEAMQGRNVFDFMPESVARRRREQMDQVIRGRQPVHFRDERQGREFDIEMYPAIDPDGAVSRLAVYATDITERVQLQALDSLLSALDRRVLRGTPLKALLAFTCEEIVRLFRLRLAWVGRKKADGQVRYMAGAGPATAYSEALQRIGVRWDTSPEGMGPAGATVRTGQAQLLRREDAAFAPWRESAEQHNLEVMLGLPLVLRGEVYGALTLYSERPDAFAATGTIERLTSLSGRISVVLESALDQERLQLLGSALSTAGNAVFITDEKGRIE